MQTASCFRFAIVAATFITGLVGCASTANTASTTSMTAADVESTKSETVAAPAPRESSNGAEPSSTKLEELPGQLVCKTANRDLGVQELRLEWNGTEAHGTIRTIAPSGETTVQRVSAEKYRGMIVVDEPGNVDLAVHAAIVAPSNGKQAMRVGSGMFATCE
jgi:hypothetical protein